MCNCKCNVLIFLIQFDHFQKSGEENIIYREHLTGCMHEHMRSLINFVLIPLSLV